MAQGGMAANIPSPQTQREAPSVRDRRWVWKAAFWVIVFFVIAYFVEGQDGFYAPKKPSVGTLDEIAKYVNGNLKQSVGGTVELPPNLAQDSITWKAYITQNDTGRYIFVPAWIGRRTFIPLGERPNNWVEGYMYTTRPIDLKAPGGTDVNLNVPGEASPEHSFNDTTIRTVPMTVAREVAPDWYAVNISNKVPS